MDWAKRSAGLVLTVPAMRQAAADHLKPAKKWKARPATSNPGGVRNRALRVAGSGGLAQERVPRNSAVLRTPAPTGASCREPSLPAAAQRAKYSTTVRHATMTLGVTQRLAAARQPNAARRSSDSCAPRDSVLRISHAQGPAAMKPPAVPPQPRARKRPKQ